MSVPINGHTQRRLNSYLFSLGNGLGGPVSYTARVTAVSKREALAMLRARFRQHPTFDFGRAFPNLNGSLEGVEHLDVYFNPNVIRTTDIHGSDPVE